YLRAAAEALAAGRQVLYLVPEIALAAQAIGQLRDRFGLGVSVLHSELTPRQRLDNWLSIRSGTSAIVVGARSALFAPLNDLGLIVVDEEHEASYKQESAPRYHAKRLARFLSERHGCPIVYGSATPSVESYREASLGVLTRLDLPNRTAQATLPAVTVENLSEGYRRGKPSILSPLLAERLGETLARGEQAILFLNRRAYAPFLVCRDCGKTFRCLNCATSLAYSQKERILRCHHCDHRETPPDECPKCGGLRILPFGIGTEKVEEFVAQTFPHARVARLDRDVTKRRGALEETLAAVSSGEIDVLVGTQMVAKGLNFPGVTLVGVIAADISLNVPDFRSSERTFQVLSQVAGRAGRGSRPGTVVVQTFNPEHVAVVCAQNHDYQTFFEHQAAERADAGYPPFRRLVNVLTTGEDRPSVVVASVEVSRRLRAVPGASVLGPADCPIERLQQRWRRHVLVKLPPDASVTPIGSALAGYAPKNVNIVIDVDPFSLM
ncbi:MAG: primosomal protein N', partial [Fimbriimonadaceae bacterium]